MNTVVVELDLPPRELAPNARPHFMAKSKATRKYRGACYLLALAASHGRRPKWKGATVKATFHFPDAGRQRDKDNLLASMKAAWDGFADAGLVDNDRNFTYLPVEIVKSPRRCVVVEVTEA